MQQQREAPVTIESQGPPPHTPTGVLWDLSACALALVGDTAHATSRVFKNATWTAMSSSLQELRKGPPIYGAASQGILGCQGEHNFLESHKEADLKSTQNIRTGEPRTSPRRLDFDPSVGSAQCFLMNQSNSGPGRNRSAPPRAEPPTLPTLLSSLPPGWHPTGFLPQAPPTPSQD